MKILADKTGQLYRVPDDEAELITEEERVRLLAEAQAEVDMLSAAAASTTSSDQGSADGSSTDSNNGSQPPAASI